MHLPRLSARARATHFPRLSTRARATPGLLRRLLGSWRRAAWHAPFLAAMTGCGGTEQLAVPDCVVPIGNAPTRGPADAWVTIVEFADFQCPYCGEAQATIATVDASRPGLRWVFKHFPLTMLHAHALPAALAADCANQQGKFWEMHTLLFANRTKLDEASLVQYATTIGLDLETWNGCRASAEASARISDDYTLGLTIGVEGTPAFFINGAALLGAYPPGDFLDQIDRATQIAARSGIPAADYYASIERQGCKGL